METSPAHVLPGSSIWQAVPKSAESNWLSLMFGSGAFIRNIEGYYPVEARLRIIGWGRYRLYITPLEPILYVSWNGKMWLLSASGRMWLANLPANAKVKGLVLPTRPILAWDTGLALPIDPERQRGDIYPSSLPIAKIRKWYATIEEIGWENDVYCLIAKKIDGRPVVQILMGTEEKITGEVLVREDTSNWVPLAAALDGVFGKGQKVPAGTMVNATFTDMKFTVTSRDVN